MVSHPLPPAMLLRLFVCVFAFVSGATLRAQNAGSPYTPPVSSRAVYDFNPEWRLHVGDVPGAEAPAFDDSSWKPVALPHAWNEDEAFKKDIAELSTGIAWYRKHFKLPANSAGKKIFLEFEGVRQAGEFYLNGKRIGLHENGVMAFGFDITSAVNPVSEDNVLAVRTDNAWDYREKSTNQRFQWADKNFNANYGGLSKNVRLHVADTLYQTLPLFTPLGTTGVYVYASDFDVPHAVATLHAEAEVRNDGSNAKTFSFEVSVRDMDGKLVTTFAAEKPITLAPGATTTVGSSAVAKGLHFWSWGYGYLYDVFTTLKVDGNPVDVVKTRTGFRKTEFAHGMVTLNDRVIQMHGYAQRTSNEWPAIGLSVPPWLSDFSNRLQVESGGNLVRWMHITPWKQDVESCDRVGLIQAMPAGDSERDVSDRRWEQRLEVMRDAIIYNRNNPSILFYESGNKGVSEEHMKQMKALRDRYDPHGGRASGSREMLASREAEYGGEMLYINKSARLPFWAMEYSRDEGLRKYWDNFSPPYHKDGDGPMHNNQPAGMYNRNQDSHAIEDVLRWYDYWRERPGTGTRVSSGGVNIVFSDTNTHHRGAENYRRSGEVDAMRIPKDGFWAHQVMWDCWVDVERPHLHILGHWNYAPGVKKDVVVVSSTDRVELFLNGRSLGMGEQRARFLFTFRDVTWEPGVLRAVGYGPNDTKELCSFEHHTAGVPAALRLKSWTSPTGFRADGADLALCEVEVVDAEGRRCPTALDLVNFEMTGPAEWRGGIAQGPDNYILARSLPVECGVNRVLVRSTTQAGKIIVRATAQGLKPAELELTTTPVKVADGLSDTPASAGLTSYLGRGPTPATPSFKVSRVTVPITSATAGSKSESASASFDDNEETAWTSESGIEKAWIEYTLGRPAQLSELTLKFTGWRELSSPLVITLDGQEVFRGNAPRSLGYVTLPLKAAKGRHLRIALAGETTSGDSYKLVEVEKAANTDTGAQRVSRNALSIIECECYEGSHL